MIVKFYYSSEGDWTDIFIDGKKVIGQHSVRAAEFCEILAKLGVLTVEPSEEWTYNEEEQNPCVNGFYLGEG